MIVSCRYHTILASDNDKMTSIAQEKSIMLIRDTFSEEDYPAKFQGRPLVGIITQVTPPRGPSPCEASEEPPYLSLDDDLSDSDEEEDELR